MFKRNTLIYLLLLLSHSLLLAQGTVLDSLENLLKKKNGLERIDILGELAYRYCFVNTDKAVEFGNEALKLAFATGDSLRISQAWNDLSSAYISRGEFEESIKNSLNALRVREKYADSLMVASTLNKLGYAYHELGEEDDALIYFYRAARIYEDENQLHLLANMYNNIGTVYLREGNEDKAIEYLQKAENLAESIEAMDVLISSKTNLAGIYFERTDYGGSEKIYSETLELIEKTGIKTHLPIVIMNLGVCKTQSGEAEDGISLIFQAIKIYEEKNDKKGLGMALVNAGNAFIWLKQFEKAEKFLEKGKKLCEETGSNLQLYFAFDGYYRLEFARGNFTKAINYLNESRRLEKIIRNERTTKRLAEMEVLYQTAKKEKELALRNVELSNAQLQNKQQQLIIATLFLGILLIVSFIIFVIRNSKLKREKLIQKSILDLQDERLRISRDLHDNIGAELTLISSSLDSKAFQSKDEIEKKELENISRYSRDAMVQLRETIWAIRQEAISLEVFAAKLREYSGKICQPHKITPTVKLIGNSSFQLSPAKTLNLYRLCQEAIHNSVKYSDCSIITIQILINEKKLNIIITDNGSGFEVDQAVLKSNGINNMESRTREMGGIFVIKSEKQKGTIITVEFLLDNN
jgi:signal transduction histidine kinase/Tfp pilus assembly protein PilF